MKLISKYKLPVVNISQFYPRPGTAAAKMKKVPTKQVKERSRKITTLFESYRCYDNLVGQEIYVWSREIETNKKYGRRAIGHTKNYVKVVLPDDDSLVGTCMLFKVTKAFKWHIEGEILQRNASPFEPETTYFNDYFPDEQISTDTESKKREETIEINNNEFPIEKPSDPFSQEKKFVALLVCGVAFIILGILSIMLKQPNTGEF